MVIHYKDRQGQWKLLGPQPKYRAHAGLRKGGPAMRKSAEYPDGYGIEVQRLHQAWKDMQFQH